MAFYCGGNIPERDSREYYPFIINNAADLFNKKSIQRVFAGSYKGLFVDEYQDCTKSQHRMIQIMSNVMSVHLFGDPLQGIMDFNNDLVSFTDDLNDFTKFPELDIPYRWYTAGNNKNLGDALKEIRATLFGEGEKIIDLSKYDGIFKIVKIDEPDIFQPKSQYRQKLNKLISNPENVQDYENLLIIVPEYEEKGIPKGNILSRAKLRVRIDFQNRLKLVEAIDDKSLLFHSKKK